MQFLRLLLLTLPVSFLWLLPLVSGDSHRISCLSDSVSRVAHLIGRPVSLMLMICNERLDKELLHNLTTNHKFFVSLFRPKEQLLAQHRDFIVLDLQCPQDQLVSALQSSHLSRVYSKWLVVDSVHQVGALDVERLLPVLQETDINQSTELFFFNASGSSLFLKQAYKSLLVDVHRVILEDYGWFRDQETFVNLRVENCTAIRRRDLQNSVFPLAVTIEDLDSLNHLDDLGKYQVDSLTKNGLQLANVLLDHLHARPHLVVARGWGNPYPAANNWTGMLGDMAAGRSEFGGSPTLVRESRVEVVDYLSHSVQTHSKIVFRAPKLSYTQNVFVLPFDRLVWLSAAALLVLVVLLLVVSTWNEWRVLVPARALEPSPEMLSPRLSDIVFLVLGNVYGQGSSTSPRSTAGRIVLLCFLVCTLVLYVSYCAFIVALLQSPASDIKTHSDLLHSQLPVGNQDTVYYRFWLPVSE